MFICALAFVLGEVTAAANIYAGKLPALSFFAATFISAAVLILIKVIAKPGTGLIVMTFILFVTGFCMFSGENDAAEFLCAAAGDDGADCVVSGRVVNITESDYGVNIFLTDTSVYCGDEVLSGGLLVQAGSEYDDSGNHIDIGADIAVTGTLLNFSEAANPGNFDRRYYYKSLGYYAYIDAGNIYVSGDGDFLRDMLRRFREAASDCVDNICPEKYAGMFKAMLLGDKSDVDEEIKSLYRANGIGHLLAISGLHISIIGMFVYRLLRKRFLFVTSGCISLSVIIMFGIMTGAGVSTVRAVIMFGIKLIADMAGRTYDLVSAASVAALIILLGNPFAIYNAAFQMSFAAVIGAGVISGVINKFLRIRNRWARRAACSVVFGASVNLAVNPIIAYDYFELPTYSMFLNLIVIPLMSIVLICGLAGIATGMIFTSAIGSIVITPGRLVLAAYEKLCAFMENVPCANIVVGRPSLAVIAIYYALLGASLISVHIFTVMRERREAAKEKYFREHYPREGVVYTGRDRRDEPAARMVRRATVIAVCAVCFLSAFYIHRYSGLYITFINVGQGDGIFIRNGSGDTYMIDGGSSSVTDVAEYRIVPYVKSAGAGDIDYVFVTHADSDHINGISDIIQSGDLSIGTVIMPYVSQPSDSYLDFVNMVENAGINIVYIKSGDVISETADGETLTFECIYPDGETASYADENDYSLVLSVTYGDFSGLFTGDIGADFETYFSDVLSYDYTLLKVAHHGSKNSTSEEFLETVNPLISVISCGKNNIYGHPHEELLERLSLTRTTVYRTDLSGAVEVRTDGERVWVKE